MLDLIAVVFIFRVRLIRLAVIKFRLSYINNDKFFSRFHLLVLTFILRMYLLILSPNLVRILLGWDGLGLSSYLLVIYYRRPKAYNSGIITALSNRFGDILILISISYLLIEGNWNLNFYSINPDLKHISYVLILAACTKRAQIPFSAWLPAAIAAPTPVSSLVHSSTLVTAGVYLIIRHSSILFLNSTSWYLLIIGAMTMLIARFSAILERDIKKIVALSTLRQLGIMIMRLGMGFYILRFFHLLRHAFFKALLFITVGRLIHNRKDYQDIRLIGRSSNSLPLSRRFAYIAIMRLIGFPFIAAFFSKEIILEFLLINNHNLYIYLVILTGILLTVIYSIRFIIILFIRPKFSETLIFNNEKNSLTRKRFFLIMVPASIGGAWISFNLNIITKVRSSPQELKLFVVLAIVLGILLIAKIGLSSKIKKNSKLNWGLFTMSALSKIRARSSILIFKTKANTYRKNLDRGSYKILIFF